MLAYQRVLLVTTEFAKDFDIFSESPRPLEEFPGAAQGPALVVEAAPYRPGDQADSEGATEFTRG